MGKTNSTQLILRRIGDWCAILGLSQWVPWFSYTRSVFRVHPNMQDEPLDCVRMSLTTKCAGNFRAWNVQKWTQKCTEQARWSYTNSALLVFLKCSSCATTSDRQTTTNWPASRLAFMTRLGIYLFHHDGFISNMFFKKLRWHATRHKIGVLPIQ